MIRGLVAFIWIVLLIGVIVAAWADWAQGKPITMLAAIVVSLWCGRRVMRALDP